MSLYYWEYISKVLKTDVVLEEERGCMISLILHFLISIQNFDFEV